MIKIVKTELMKLQRYSVVWIGVAAMLSVVLLTRFCRTETFLFDEENGIRFVEALK